MKLQSWRSSLVAISLILIGALAWASLRTLAQALPRGLVEEPRMDGVDVAPAPDASFVFKGWVDFPGSSGVVEIDAFNFGNGDSDDEPSSQIAVARAVPSNIPTIVSDPGTGLPVGFAYLWTVGPIQVFQPNRWPEGGTARVRFRAILRNLDGTTSQSLLPVRDRDGVTGLVDQLILADKNPTPATPPQGGPTPDFLNRKPPRTAEDKLIYSEAETQRYYAAVGTSATGDGLSIAAALPTLSAFRKRYFDDVPDVCRSEGPEAVTRYFNQGDLGLGREMHCLWNTCNEERACYVANYGRRDGSALFNNKAESFEALKAGKPFATVAMVERGRMPITGSNRVFFAVYDHQKNPVNPPLAFNAPLDNKGFNTFIPGNCLVCHGSGGAYERAPTPRVQGAFFLPFDLSAFAFYSAVPTDSLSRVAQEDEFKLLNRLVYFTALGSVNPDANELISGWYGGSFSGPQFFNDGFIAAGWTQTGDTRQVYQRVLKPTCRSCHITHGGVLTFGTFENFNLFRALIYERLCVSHGMPNAEQSTKIFWRSDARPQFLNRTANQFGCGFELPSSSATATATSLPSAAFRRPALEVFQDYKAQSCACFTRECLDAVERNFIGEFATMTYGSPSHAGAIETLRSEAVECHLNVLRP